MSLTHGRGGRRRQRIAAAAMATALASLVAIFTVPAPASAADLPPGKVNCKLLKDVVWVPVQPGSISLIGYRDYQLVSATPTFDVVESRTAQNDLDAPISATFTSSLSRTVTMTVTIGVTAKFNDFVSSTVTTSVTVSRTSMIGVSTTAPVPPHSRVIAEYGIAGYDVVFTGQRFNGVGIGNVPILCVAGAREQGTGHAPTTSEGWRVRLG
jgi:hypothetical protein